VGCRCLLDGVLGSLARSRCCGAQATVLVSEVRVRRLQVALCAQAHLGGLAFEPQQLGKARLELAVRCEPLGQPLGQPCRLGRPRGDLPRAARRCELVLGELPLELRCGARHAPPVERGPAARDESQVVDQHEALVEKCEELL
jgi:hypothetical protein